MKKSRLKQLAGLIEDRFFVKARFDETDAVILQQKKAAVVYCALGLVLVLVLFSAGLIAGQHPFLVYSNLVLFLFLLLDLVFFCSGAVSVIPFLTSYALLIQLKASAEMIFAAVNFSVYNLAVIFVDMIVMMLVVLVLIMAYVKYMPVVASWVSMAVYLVCVLVSGSPILESFFFMIFFLFIASSLLGGKIVSNVYAIKKENEKIISMQQDFLDSLGMDMGQLKSFISLSRQDKFKLDPNNALLDVLGKESGQKLKRNVAYIIEQEKIDYDNLKKALPQLTASELEICCLVLQGRKLGDMVNILGKTPSNITCQRANIRSKLGLGKGDNLRDALLKIAHK